MTKAELMQMTDDDLILWKDELPVEEFRALLLGRIEAREERDEAREVARAIFCLLWNTRQDRDILEAIRSASPWVEEGEWIPVKETDE